MAEVPREYVEELARLLWQRYRGRRVTLDALGRPNYFATRAFARGLLELARSYGVGDPLHEIDWLATIDPDISREENLRRLEEYFSARGGRRRSPGEAVDEAITRLEEYIAFLREELATAPEEYRPSIEEELRRAERELEELRRASRPEARRARPPRRPRPPRARRARPPTPAPPPPPAYRPSVEEARAAFEAYIRRVPRVYRVDWTGLKARISYHRAVEEELKRVLEELGAEIERVVEARPPLRIIYADFSKTTPPPVPLPPHLERYLLWSKFSAILSSRGLSPEDYRDDFENTLRALQGRPLEEKQKRIEELARSIAPPAPPVAAVVPPELARELEEIRREIARLRTAAAWRPRTAEELKMAIEAAWMPEPRIVLRLDEEGHPYWGPDDKTLSVLRNILDRWAYLYFTMCPVCRFMLPGGALEPVDFVNHLIEKEGAVPPIYQDWLKRLARLIQEAEQRGPPTA